MRTCIFLIFMFFHSVTACYSGMFLVPGMGCVDCWKCCLFGSYYKIFDNSYYRQICNCNNGSFCEYDADCGSGLYCTYNALHPVCKSCLECDNARCTEYCSGINTTLSEDAAFKVFLDDPLAVPNKHSFYWSCPQSTNSVSPPGCPCNKKLNISCVNGSSCVPGIYGTSSDIVLTGGVLNYGSIQGLCQSCSSGYLCDNGYNAIPCPPGSYCPNSSSIFTCPPGYYCGNSSTTPVSCKYAGVYRGNICERNSTIGNQLCPEGYYCPNVSTKYICPSGTYCKIQSISPTPCPVLTRCNEGSSYPQGPSWIVWIIVSSVLLLGLIIIWFPFQNLYIWKTKDIRIESIPKWKSVRIHEIHYANMSVGTWLADNSGIFMGTKLNAVMGSSGCGKSTLIELLRGRVEPRTLCHGNITVYFKSIDRSTLRYNVNENDWDLHQFRKYIGFVPQDDLLYSDLTVKENLIYSHGWKLFHTNEIIDTVICKLGLTKIAHNIVGSVQKRGISGGQRKRTNIGMELVGIHPLIIMDEPTSGLDSTGSYEVLKYSKDYIEEFGTTFICVVHQPRFSSFILFDNLTLLGKSGCVFTGSPSECLAYFSLGVRASLNYNDNPGDAIMDMITYGFTSKDSKRLESTHLPELWRTKGQQWLSQFKKQVGNCDTIICNDYNINDSIISIIANFNDVYDAYEMVKFFEIYTGIVIALKDAQRFVGGHTISSKEFIRRWSEICSNQNIDDVSNSLMLAKLEKTIIYGAPQSILFDENVDRWKQIRIDALVVEFIHKLLKATGKDTSKIIKGVGHDWRGILDKEILYATLKIKCVYTTQHTASATDPEIYSTNDCNRPSMFTKMYNLICRRTVSFQRSPWFIQLCVTMAAALIVGAIHGSDWNSSGFSGNVVMAMACIGVLGVVTHVRTFSIDKDVMSREIKNGLPLTLCLISYQIVDALWLFVIPSLFFGIYGYMTFPATNIGWFILTGIMVEWWVSGMAYIVSVLPIGIAWVNLLGVFISIIFGAFINGVHPTVADVKGTIGEVILGFSYNRWAMEIMTLKELDSIWNVQPETVVGIAKHLGLCGYPSDEMTDRQKLNMIYSVIHGDSFNNICSRYIAVAFVVLFAEGAAFRLIAWLIYWLGWNGFTLSLLKTNFFNLFKLIWHRLLRLYQRVHL